MAAIPVWCDEAPYDATPAEKATWDLNVLGSEKRWWRHWRNTQLANIPESFALPVASAYRAYWHHDGWQKANAFLEGAVQRIADLELDPALTDGDLIALAERLAKDCRQALQDHQAHRHIAGVLLRLCHRHGVRPPPRLSHCLQVDSQGCIDRGSLARLTDAIWWRRKLRVAHGRILEAEAIRLHQVHRRAGRYVSDPTFARHQQQRRRNQRVLSDLFAENELGEAVNLAEIATHSLANPAIRRAELMTRIYGFDHISIELGHSALLLTVTCPSRMHSHLSDDGKHNPNFDPSFTPREAQRYLTKLWARIRAKWQRESLRPYGFRITEPHHDGTPHWHVLLFVEAEREKQLIETVRNYALADTPNEPGASKHRFQVERIDRAKGSATGYVAKYISKNIDGFGLNEDAQAATGAQRVAAWASTWGIRQFQQVGGPPIGLWREFRRCPHLKDQDSLVGLLAGAADDAKWAEFVRLLGGPQRSRKDLPIALEKYEEQRLGRYGEPLGTRIAGITMGNVVFTTRFHVWSIKRKTEQQNCTQSPAPGSEREKGVSLSASPPWSSVNNCTNDSTRPKTALYILR